MSINNLYSESSSLLYLPSVFQFIQNCGKDFVTDHLLSIYIDYLVEFQKEYSEDVESLMNEKISYDNNSSEVNHLIKNYYQYISGNMSILDSNGDIILYKYLNDKSEITAIKNFVISRLTKYTKDSGFVFCHNIQLNNEEYDIIYNNISNRFNFSDKEIHERIKEWGLLTKTYSIVRQNEPGKNLGPKLANQSFFTNDELFFIKSLISTFSLSKSEQLYKDEEGTVMVDVESIKEEDEYYLIPIFKLFTNLGIINSLKFPEFVDALKNKEIEMPSLEVYSYTLQEIEQAYIIQFNEFQKQQLENNEPIKNIEAATMIKKELCQLREGSIKNILNQLVQENWIYKDPSKQYRPTIKFQLEFEKYFDSNINCRFCNQRIITHQGVICKNCKECGICLDCSYSYLQKNKLGLNRKDNSVVDGKWCPECSEPWRKSEHVTMII
ncbi:hypothetical protein HANVADRAFT_54393 [Hanseniaspora valbyensis NRRL Y-1626]|uniref:Uncharacterized protein n=1 Tax=Hanseniaspora valbyensis NRRL Y-1626 TaxID=766949 RepID=A0A1B7T784_9ASCO|nr:hypothetical protein HANVADRAFT_54393 [Hanseniaspora valbyensis NRRL Y-1626]